MHDRCFYFAECSLPSLRIDTVPLLSNEIDSFRFFGPRFTHAKKETSARIVKEIAKYGEREREGKRERADCDKIHA